MKKDVVLTQAGWRCKCGEDRGTEMPLKLTMEVGSPEPPKDGEEIEMIESTETYPFVLAKK